MFSICCQFAEQEVQYDFSVLFKGFIFYDRVSFLELIQVCNFLGYCTIDAFRTKKYLDNDQFFEMFQGITLRQVFLFEIVCHWMRSPHQVVRDRGKLHRAFNAQVILCMLLCETKSAEEYSCKCRQYAVFNVHLIPLLSCKITNINGLTGYRVTASLWFLYDKRYLPYRSL
ncbi:hypothetical protein D9M68_814870 [compost metagenome]